MIVLAETRRALSKYDKCEINKTFALSAPL